MSAFEIVYLKKIISDLENLVARADIYIGQLEHTGMTAMLPQAYEKLALWEQALDVARDLLELARLKAGDA